MGCGGAGLDGVGMAHGPFWLTAHTPLSSGRGIGHIKPGDPFSVDLRELPDYPERLEIFCSTLSRYQFVLGRGTASAHDVDRALWRGEIWEHRTAKSGVSTLQKNRFSKATCAWVPNWVTPSRPELKLLRGHCHIVVRLAGLPGLTWGSRDVCRVANISAVTRKTE